MKSLIFAVTPGEACTARDLPLRMPQVSGIIDPEPFRARARGEGPALAEAFARTGGMRSLHCDVHHRVPLFDMGGALLTFVISGQLEVATANRGSIQLEPGDLLLSASGTALDPFVTAQGNCRLIQLAMEAAWPGERARPVTATRESQRKGTATNLKRMFKGTDDQSHFRNFDNLFGPIGQWSAVTPLVGLRFIAMAEDTFIDWHPEIVNNLVIVLSGALELEVGGGAGGVEIFLPGDVCLAEDRTGEGHIDRMHGLVQVAVLIVDDADLWP